VNAIMFILGGAVGALIAFIIMFIIDFNNSKYL